MIEVIASLKIFIQILIWLILVKCLLSWIPQFDNGFTNMVNSLTEPLLGPVRDLLMNSQMLGDLPIDFSPIIVILILESINAMF